MWPHICMAGPMAAYRCDVTSVLAAQMPCQPTNFCLLLLSAVPTLPTLNNRAVVMAQLVNCVFRRQRSATPIQSSTILFTSYQLYHKLYWNDENKKEAGNGPTKK